MYKTQIKEDMLFRAFIPGYIYVGVTQETFKKLFCIQYLLVYDDFHVFRLCFYDFFFLGASPFLVMCLLYLYIVSSLILLFVSLYFFFRS